jgi:hypothetical protein
MSEESMELGRVDYTSATPPDGYRCTTCGVHGCKLWREYQTAACYTELVCCDCAGRSQGEDVSDIDEDGKIAFDLGRTDAIGWRVPAVPTEDGSTFWGYTSVPDAGVMWWRRLPTRTPEKAYRVAAADVFGAAS